MIALYLYATGAQRQTISVLSTLGLSESYSNIISRNVRRKRVKKAGTVTELPLEAEVDTSSKPSVSLTGTLPQLSEAMRARAREVASSGLFASVYDNINYQFKNSEQVIGRHGAPLQNYFSIQ